MIKALCVLAFATSAAASALNQPALKPALTLRGGAYPPPKAGYHALAAKGTAATKQAIAPNLVSGTLAGCYVSFGAILSLSVASALGDVAPGVQKLVFGLLFPIALLNIVATGVQLFTGNTASVAAAYFEGLVSPMDLVRNWVVTYGGNLIGSLLTVEAFSATGLLSGSVATMAAKVATGKCTASFGQQVAKGVFANWLVCLAAFMATLETDLAGKIMGIYICISTFVMCGFEHSIANLFLLPLGIRAGAEVSVMDTIVKNVIPVTLGNIIAGAVVFAASYSFLYGKLGGHSKD
jgi:formate/nitrite transporter